MLTLAIQPDEQLLMSGRMQSFSARWIDRAHDAGVTVRVANVYDCDPLKEIRGSDGFLWWFAHLPERRQSARRIVQAVAHGLGVPTFPNWQTIWHFDDKVAQRYLLDAAGIRMPETHVFWDEGPARRFIRGARFPLVLKLAGGIVSENVRRVDSREEAEYWVARLFGSGLTSLDGWPRPSRRARAWTRIDRSVGALTGRAAPVSRRTELQRGYVLFQEFIEGNAFDTRVTIIGDRAFAFRRLNRPGDFRASGSGRIDWDPAGIDTEALAFAFAAARRLRTQSLAVDVLRRRDGALVMTEISYYYEGWAVAACPGHWSPDLTWHDGSVLPEDAIFDDFVAEASWGARRSVAT